MPDPEPILPRIVSGEPEAMSACIDRYKGLVWAIARRHVVSSEDAQDLTQEIFTQLWRDANRYDPERPPESAFVALIAKRRSIDFLRKRGRTPETEPLMLHAQTLEAPSASIVDSDLAMRALATLPRQDQELFHMRFGLGMSQTEIAQRTNLPLGTVKTRMRAGLIQMRRRIDADRDNERTGRSG